MKSYGSVKDNSSDDVNESTTILSVKSTSSQDEYDSNSSSTIQDSIAGTTNVLTRDWRYTLGLFVTVVTILTLPIAFSGNNLLSSSVGTGTTDLSTTTTTTTTLPMLPTDVIGVPSSVVVPIPQLLVPSALISTPSSIIIPGLPTMISNSASPTEFPTEEPTEHPTYFDKDDDRLLHIYDKYDLRFTTNRDGYKPLSYFAPNASDIYAYKFLRPYTGVVEPYADMWISITNDGSENDGTVFYHKFTICADNEVHIKNYNKETDTISKSKCIDGFEHNTTFNFACDALSSNYTITVIQYNSATMEETSRYSDGALLCQYVRREFRALTASDLATTMDAMYTMWEIEEEDGQELYGKNYHNYAYLLEFHYFNAAWIDSDHVHEGNGFAAQHFKMSNIFELSMQSVEPSISLPYWDFTIENAYNISVWNSPVFTADTFGTLNLPNNLTWGWLYETNSIDDGKIADGRWASRVADYNEKFDDLDFAYGYMRAPWNMNPSKYITRYTSIDKELPTCSSHYELLEYSSITDFLHQIPYAAHASTHGVIGGVFGCDVMNSLREAGYILSVDAQLNLCKNWIFYLKEFYRSDVLLPSAGCSAVSSVSGEYSVEKSDLQCDYVCNNDRMNILFLMLKHSVLNSDYDCIPTDDMPDAGWTAWKEFICGGEGSKVFGGDHLESASPADPSFWPIHPTLERLLQVKYMAGGFDTDTWTSDAANEYVCNKATCYSSELDDFVYDEDCCYGHFQHDRMFDAPNNDRNAKVGPTNSQIHDWTNPTKDYYGMPYIYDDFTWEHCAETGTDFDALINTLYSVGADALNVTDTSDSEKGWRRLKV